METPNISIEFFPPKTPEGAEKLRVARQKLAELNPKYFSVTFGQLLASHAQLFRTFRRLGREKLDTDVRGFHLDSEVR